MIPHERSLVALLKDEPFALIGINSDRDLVEYRNQAILQGVTWRSFWCGESGTDGLIPTAWNVTNWPTVYVIDVNGVIRFKDVREEALTAAVQSLLATLKSGNAASPKK
ncbi:MAG: hypothetical protein NT107_08275 [Planctomycetota bacterium]|nr:hypothetical protein [Planctomycetota bacterium]MSR38077.1 hypothetical protein [Planctomycetota bacterium]